ncbi:head decoration protein [Niallia sp. 03190]|uniref:head decoration protein n=1 Tax=Niallia sp. 03190 TaxID=3458061 RepID=UPI004044CCD4
MENLYETVSTFTPDNLFAGHNVPVITQGIVLAKNQGIIQRGTVVGIISASGLATPVDKNQTDGSQVPFGIVTDTVDTGTSETNDKPTTAYTSGLFNKNALIFGEGNTAADHKGKLRDSGIFLQENVSY